MMINKWPEFTPVRHKSAKYQGWIHSTTKITDLFTGNTNTPWQYTIRVADEDRMRVAPPEDLERISEKAPFPPYITLCNQGGDRYQEESRLHSLRYQVADMAWEDRWIILLFVAVPILGVHEVVHTLLSLIHNRTKMRKEHAQRYMYALTEWRCDLDMIMDRFNNAEEIKTSETRSYLLKVNRELDSLKIENKYESRKGQFEH
jgi:hypothetical protein